MRKRDQLSPDRDQYACEIPREGAHANNKRIFGVAFLVSLTEKILIPFGKTTQSEQNKDAFSFNQTQKTSHLVEVGESIAGNTT